MVATAALWVAFGSSGNGSGDENTASAATAPDSSSAPGAVSVAGVQVAIPSVDLGRIALDTPVKHSFQLRNTGVQRASLGRARIEVLEGC